MRHTMKLRTKRWMGAGLLAGALVLGGACSSTETPVQLAQVTPGTAGTSTGAPAGAPVTPGTTTGTEPIPGTTGPGTGTGTTGTGTGGSGAALPQPYTATGSDGGLGANPVLPPGTSTTAPGTTAPGTTGTGTGGSGTGTTLTPDTNTSGTFLPPPSGSVLDGGSGF